MENYKELLEYIQRIFDTKFDALDSKLDMINMSLNANHTKLEYRVSACEDEIDVIKHRPRDDKVNLKSEIVKTLIHWGIPITILALIYYIKMGKIV